VDSIKTLIEDFISSNTNIVLKKLGEIKIILIIKKYFSRLSCHLKIEENDLFLQKIIQKSMFLISLDPIIKLKHLEINANLKILELAS